MRTQGYIDTFHETMTPNAGQFVPLTILVGIWNTPVVVLVLICKTLHMWQKRFEQRQQLGRQDTRSLHDMGMSRQEAAGEAAKPFWVG